MSTHIEWLDAASTHVAVFAPGEVWAGHGQHARPVLTLAGDEVVAIEGTPDEIRALAALIGTVAARAERRTP